MDKLLVAKSLEQRGQIGPLYIHEAVFLLLGCLLIFFALSIIRYWVPLSAWWYTSTPCLFIIGLVLAKALRKESNPTWFFSYTSFYFQQPKYLYIQAPTLTTSVSHLEVSSISRSIKLSCIWIPASHLLVFNQELWAGMTLTTLLC